MTTTADSLARAAQPTMYDRWLLRVGANPRLRRLYAWLAPTLVTLLAAVLRLWNLGHPQELVFDETYYVKDAWSQWNLGYAATWPEGADERFAAGQTGIFTTEGSFVVHPPLGKYLIGAGMALFGADSSFGWRIAVALCGTACVLVLYLLARSLTNSVVFATVASFLLAIDGLGIVMSRVALLDVILTMFTLLAFWFTVLDRRGYRDRVAAGIAARAGDSDPPVWGPVVWNRPWLVAAGAAAGAAAATKWSGLWVLAGIGIYLVVTDALARRRWGVTLWPADAAFRQGPATFLLLVPVAFVVYLASWTGWLVTDGGYDRARTDPGGMWSWVPQSLRNLWHYHETIYSSTSGITTSHPYMSPAWQWPLLWRPTSMFVATAPDGSPGCAGANGCIESIYSMPNPLVWWGGVAAVLFLAYLFVRTRDWRYAFVLTAVAATYAPWLLFAERTIFQFYTIVILPFMLLALTFALREIAGAGRADPARRKVGQRTVLVFLAFVVVLSAFWYPLWTGVQVPYDFYHVHAWMPGWI